MPTRAIPHDLLGPEAQRLLYRDGVALLTVLDRLGPADWSLKTRFGGSTIIEMVEHLAEDASRIARAWSRRDEASNDPLFRALENPDVHPTLERKAEDPQQVVEGYQRAMEQVEHVLSNVRQNDWVWPASSPIGGTETLAEATRRWLAHHYVHRMDVHEILGEPTDVEENVVRLVVEFALDALARTGRDLVPYHLSFEVITANPGAGTWTLIFDEQPRPELDIWQELLNWVPENPPDHRLERGVADAPRVRVRGDGEQVWRSGFARGASWDKLEVHADDEALEIWKGLVDSLTRQLKGTDVSEPATTGLGSGASPAGRSQASMGRRAPS